MAGPSPREIMPRFEEYLISGQLEYRPASNSWLLRGTPQSERMLARQLAYDLNVSIHKSELVVSIKSAQLRAKAHQAVGEWVIKLEAHPVNDDPLRRFLNLMQREGTDPELAECHVWAMKQWIWQVKRNIIGKRVTHQTLPIFWSRENGTGKSFNLGRFLEPLRGHTKNLSVDELGERFSKKLLSQTYVAFFDEFAGAADIDAGTFKAMITGKPLEGREMYSEGGFYAENRVACIATSNLAPPHDFEDSSGARRFWSIHCASEAKSGNSERGKALDAVDWPAIWRAISWQHNSVEELVPPAILARMVHEREVKNRSKTSTEQFVAECIEPAPSPEVRTPLKAVLEAYRMYCVQAGLRREKGGQAILQARLTDLGFRCVNCSTARFLCAYQLRDDS